MKRGLKPLVPANGDKEMTISLREHFNELVAKELEKIADTYGGGFYPTVEGDLNAREVEWRTK